MRIKVKYIDSNFVFTYDDVVTIGEFINVIQIMRKDSKPELFDKSSIESIRIYIDENSDGLPSDSYEVGYNKGYTDEMNTIAGIESR